MSSNIILNKNNIENYGQGNNKLSYTLPRDVKFEKGDTVAISHLNIYFSWFNITAKNHNNKFFYKWWDMNGELTVLNEVIIPDGFYSVNTLQEYLFSYMVAKGHHLITLTGSYVYFIEILTNETYYSVSFRLSSVSPNMDLGDGMKSIELYCQPPTTWAIPANYETPEIIIPSKKLVY